MLERFIKWLGRSEDHCELVFLAEFTLLILLAYTILYLVALFTKNL